MLARRARRGLCRPNGSPKGGRQRELRRTEQDFVDGSPLQLALREMRGVLTSPFALGGMALAIVVLGLSGPFGTFESFNLAERLAYWGAMVVPCYLTGQGSVTLLLGSLERRVPARWPRVLIAAVISSLPLTLIVSLVDSIAYRHLAPENLLSLWFDVAVVTLVIVVSLSVSTERMRRLAAAGPAGMAPQPAAKPAPVAPDRSLPPILQRVPLPQRGKLLALTVEDHYVDIVTDRGKTLVLMRLADAIRETAGVDGLQIHRSHWVARDAVVRSHRADGKLGLELRNALKLPVSRGFLPQVKAAGLG